MSSLILSILTLVLIVGVGVAAGITLVSLITQLERDWSVSEEQVEEFNNNLKEQINSQKDK